MKFHEDILNGFQVTSGHDFVTDRQTTRENNTSPNPTGGGVARLRNNKNQKMSSFKSNENIHKREGGSYYIVSANKASSVTL